MSFKALYFAAVLCLSTTTSVLGVGPELMVLPLGVTKEFVCTAPPGISYVIYWLVNGQSAAASQVQDYIDVGEEVHLDSGVLQRNLTLTAETRANNTHIQCDVYPLGGERYTAVDMTVTLQGELSPPAVDMARDQHSVVFSWNAPFTLNISDMEPDILHYVVYIIRDDGHNETVNTTDTRYELQADPCQSHKYHVEIAAVNVVSEGEKYRSPEMNSEGYAVAGVLDTSVSLNGRLVLIQITLETSPHCHDFVVNYEVELISNYSKESLLFNCSSNARQHTLSLNSLNLDELYICFVRIEGLPNSESTRMELRTFDVQDVRTTIHDQHSGYINITCYFTKGSDAKGCRIFAQNNAISCEFVATREEGNESTVTVALPSGTYTLLVYDDEEEADNNPAFTVHSVHSSAQVSECANVSSYDTSESVSTNNVLLIAIPASVSSIILIAAIVTAIFLTCVRKYKGKKQFPSDIEWNDYTSVPVQQSSSSESTDSSRVSSGSDLSEQSIGVHVTGHSHDLQYADVHVARKHTMTHPPPTSSEEPVNYAILQPQNTSSHSNKSQGTMDAGQLPGSHTPDDSN